MPDYQNIRLKDGNVAFDGLYFYSIDNDTDTLLQKTDDGTLAFSYPLNKSITNEIISLDYEGIMQPYRMYISGSGGLQDPEVLSINGMSFWSLEKDGSNGLIIRKFTITNFAAIQDFQLEIPEDSPQTGDVWDVDQMAVEIYETKLSSSLSSGNTTISIYENLLDDGSSTNKLALFDGPSVPALPTTADSGSILALSSSTTNRYDAILKRFKYDKKTSGESEGSVDEIIKAGMKITIGPSTASGYTGQYKTIVVSSLGSRDSSKSFTLDIVATAALSGSEAFNEGDPVRFTRGIFLFNNNGNTNRSSGDGVGTGALYVIRSWETTTPSVELYYGGDDGGLFAGVEGATFSQRDRKVVFTRATNAIFMEPNVNNITFVKTATLDNLNTNTNQPLEIKDLCTSFGGTLFRLQDEQEFDGDLQSWSTNNYIVTPLFSLVKSISVRAEPQIIAADDVDTADITVTVRDQFNQPVAGVTVTLSDDNAVGEITNISNSGVTDSNGQVTATYDSGTDNTIVTITATVSQLNP